MRQQLQPNSWFCLSDAKLHLWSEWSASVFYEHEPFPPVSSHFQYWKHSSSWKATVSCTAWRGQYFQLISPNFEKLQLLNILISFGTDCKQYHWTSSWRLFSPPFLRFLNWKRFKMISLCFQNLMFVNWNDILVCSFFYRCWHVNQGCHFSTNNVNVGGTSEPWHEINTIKENQTQIFACILLTSNQMIFLVQFGINKHS